MISEEVERSAQAAQALEQQTDTLQRTREQYGVYSGVLTQSAAIVSELATRDRMDRLMLLVGLLIFLASAVYVVRRRVGWIFAFPFGATSATTTTTSKLISASTSSTIVESTTVTDVVEHWIASAVEDVLETVVYQRDGEEL
ncbi:Sec20-domain-containing protein [Cladochytrium replicatum]|nr:Sec20-domain-containing protein [Cladochytrium replicatum]